MIIQWTGPRRKVASRTRPATPDSSVRYPASGHLSPGREGLLTSFVSLENNLIFQLCLFNLSRSGIDSKNSSKTLTSTNHPPNSKKFCREATSEGQFVRPSGMAITSLSARKVDDVLFYGMVDRLVMTLSTSSPTNQFWKERPGTWKYGN